LGIDFFSLQINSPIPLCNEMLARRSPTSRLRWPPGWFVHNYGRAEIVNLAKYRVIKSK
jgi:hypothetical protein